MTTQHRQASTAVAACLLLAGASGMAWSQSPAEPTWYDHYERGVALVEEGKGQEARPALEQALALRADEGLRLRTAGPRYVDYLPQLYLAIACHMSGDLAAARRHLAQAESSGVAAKSVAGANLLAAFRDLLAVRGELETPPGEKPPAPATPDSRPRFEVYDRRPVVLSESEFEALRKDVLSRCRLSTAAVPRNAPWYYHYELGLALERRGDNQRALDALIEAAHDKPEPQQLARIYGVWYLNYLPYLAIAKAHARLGNRECALDALRLSRSLKETDEDSQELRELLAEIKNQE